MKLFELKWTRPCERERYHVPSQKPLQREPHSGKVAPKVVLFRENKVHFWSVSKEMPQRSFSLKVIAGGQPHTPKVQRNCFQLAVPLGIIDNPNYP